MPFAGKDAMPSLSSSPKKPFLAGSLKLKPKRQTDGGAGRNKRLAAILDAARQITSAGIRWARSTAGGSFGGGLAAGLYAVAFCHPLTARFGTGLTFVAGAFAAATFGLLIGAIGWGSRAARPRWQAIVPCAVLAVWAIAGGWLVQLSGLFCRSMDLDTVASPLVQAAVACGASLLLIGVPVACAARLSLGNSRPRVGWLLSGGATGLIMAAHFVGPWLGIQWAGWIAAVCSLAVIASRPRPSLRSVPPAQTSGFSRPVLIGTVFASLTAGMAAAALERLTLQLFPSAEAMQWTAWAGFLMGTAAGWRWTRRRLADQQRQTAAWLVLAGGFCTALTLVLFPVLTDWFLDVTSNVSQVGLLMGIRGALAAALLFPLGAAWASLVGLGRRDGACPPGHESPSPEEQDAHPDLLLKSTPALFGGYLAARWLLSQGLDVPALAGGAAMLLGVAGAGLSFPGTTWSGRWRKAVATAAIVALVGAGRLGVTYSPARAARLLFSTTVFMERNTGTELRLLPFLDDGRLLAAQEGDRGTYTLWKHHGVQIELRENGIPLGTYCGRADLCPQFSGQVLTAVLPLALHEAPRRVLMLGLGTGGTLLACLEFPVAEVTCVEGDRRLVALLDRTVWPSGLANPRSDNRVRIVELDPAAAVQSRGGSFDVILSDTDPAGVATGTPYFTREFYAGAAAQLGADGIFAQRFRYVDFGPWPIRSVLATLRNVFTQVAAVEAGGGEFVLLATNSPNGLNRADLLKRFQAPQVARALSHVGWDWSVALNLGAYWGTSCDEMIRSSPLNTASNGLFAFRLPQETMRWGSKRDELAQALSSHAGRIAEWPNAEGDDPELLRRLTDVITQRELMTAYPDQPWAYRKAVRDELKKHPHTVIADADNGFDRQLHPVDQHRLNYFDALGRAARARRPTLEALHQLEEFAEPYDPVLTYFVHHELSALYARSGSLDPAAHLRHRLYTVYYGDIHDLSIRDVVEALHLLVNYPQAFPATGRWDHMNALLQFLKLRWNNRGPGKPSSLRIALNDLERSISVAESTFSEMEKLREVVGVSESDWRARREVLERSLVRPLRSYQSELLPDYLKETQRPATAENRPAASARQNAN
jgi:spermidine synthase